MFSENVEKKELCKVKYNEKDLQLLRDAIEDLYYFEFVIGELQTFTSLSMSMY